MQPRFNIFGRRSLEHYQFLQAMEKKYGLDAAREYAFSIGGKYGIGEGDLEFHMSGNRIGQQFVSSTAESLTFLTDSLTFIDLEAREQQYLAPNRWSKFIPVKRNVPRGPNRAQFFIYDYSGRARPVSHDGRDFPAAQVIRREDSTPLIDNGISAQWTLPEIESAQFQGIPLEEKSMMAAAIGIRNYKEITWFTGDSSLGPEWQRGIINQPTTGTNAVRYMTTSTAWDAASPPTALAIANLLLSGIRKIIVDSNEIIGTTIVGDIVIALPTIQHAIVHERAVSDHHPDQKIADYVMGSAIWDSYHPGGMIMFASLRELKDAGLVSNATADRACIFVKADDILFGTVVIEGDRLEIERENTLYKCPIRARIGPLYVGTPGGIVYIDGI